MVYYEGFMVSSGTASQASRHGGGEEYSASEEALTET